MKKFLLAALAIVGVGISVSSGAARANLVYNGDFATGDFNGWILAEYGSNGGGGDGGPDGSPYPAVTSFNVTGSSAQNALTLQVGLTSGPFGAAPRGGASLSQVFSTATSGLGNFSASIASSGHGNFDYGQFDVLIDGIQIASYGFGASTGTGITLTGTDLLSVGTHTLEIDISRKYYNSPGTPLQYITNINLAVTGATALAGAVAAVPEPCPLVILGTALTVLATVRSRRRSA